MTALRQLGGRSREDAEMVTDHSEELAKRVADELGIDDWLWVEEAVRRRHRILFLRYEKLDPEEYEALRDSIEADLIGEKLP